MHRFRAKLYKIGFLRCVDVPTTVSLALGAGATIPVRGRAAGVAFRSTLVPRGNRAHRLFVHSRIWRARRVDVGESLEILLERDLEPRESVMAPELRHALDRRPSARAAYQRAPLSLQREIGNSIAAARRSETRERRLEKALDHLEARRPRSRSAR